LDETLPFHDELKPGRGAIIRQFLPKVAGYCDHDATSCAQMILATVLEQF
jgi:hypothetical protein